MVVTYDSPTEISLLARASCLDHPVRLLTITRSTAAAIRSTPQRRSHSGVERPQVRYVHSLRPLLHTRRSLAGQADHQWIQRADHEPRANLARRLRRAREKL